MICSKGEQRYTTSEVRPHSQLSSEVLPEHLSLSANRNAFNHILILGSTFAAWLGALSAIASEGSPRPSSPATQ